MKRFCLSVCCAMLASAAVAGSLSSEGSTLEASMLVTGSVVIAPDGKVQSYALDKPEKLPSGVVEVIRQTLSKWVFDPILVADKPVAVKAGMSLRVVASKRGKSDFAVSVSGASFGQDRPGEYISNKAQYSPIFPHRAQMDHASGTAFALVKVGRQGQVVDAAVEQVNLAVLGSKVEMTRWREEFAKASLDAAKRWTYFTPTAGKHVDDSFWYGLVPVVFAFESDIPRAQAYGHWEGYVAGPHEPIPWLDNVPLAVDSADAVADGAVRQLDSDFQLRTR